MSEERFSLTQDRKGMTWDLLLYIPTVTALLSMSAKFWFGNDANLAYLLLFLGSFFLIAGANRVLKTRLMLLPSAPVAIGIDRQAIHLELRNGERVGLLKDLRYYPDYAGRSFGLSGMDGTGRRLQFVFHKGQFPSEQDYKTVQDALRNQASS
jgi:hypothetical protein